MNYDFKNSFAARMFSVSAAAMLIVGGAYSQDRGGSRGGGGGSPSAPSRGGGEPSRPERAPSEPSRGSREPSRPERAPSEPSRGSREPSRPERAPSEPPRISREPVRPERSPNYPTRPETVRPERTPREPSRPVTVNPERAPRTPSRIFDSFGNTTTDRGSRHQTLQTPSRTRDPYQPIKPQSPDRPGRVQHDPYNNGGKGSRSAGRNDYFGGRYGDGTSRPGFSNEDLNRSVYTKRNVPNDTKWYDRHYTSTALPRGDGNLPYLVRRSENVRVGFYRYYRDNYGYYAPSWHSSYYCYEPIEYRTCFSPFYFYACLPGYLSLSHVVYVSRPTVTILETPCDSSYYVQGGYYKSNYGARDEALYNAISDIRRAWEDGDYNLFRDHLYDSSRVAIYIDGRYAYSLNASDYQNVSRDAIETVKTNRFTIDRVTKRENGDIVLYGTHTYELDEGDIRKVYVSFTLEKSDGNYYIIEAGSSASRRLGY